MMLAAAAAWVALTGTWVFRFEGQNIFTVRLDAASQTGLVRRPHDLRIERDGSVSATGGEIQELPVENATWRNGQLEFTVDGDQFQMRLLASARARLTTEGLSPLMLTRVHEPVNLATALPTHSFSEEILALQRTLAKMAEQDQAARLAFDHAQAEGVDEANRPGLLALFQRHGWITTKLAGRKAADHFALLVQHQTPEIQRRLLPALDRVARAGDAPMADYAYLFDRVQVGRRWPQRWGTQMRCVQGTPVLFPVKNAQTLDQRREAIGLAPTTEYLGGKYLRDFCASMAATAVPRP